MNIDIEYKNTTENMLSRIMQVYGSYQTIHKREECTTYVDYIDFNTDTQIVKWRGAV